MSITCSGMCRQKEPRDGDWSVFSLIIISHREGATNTIVGCNSRPPEEFPETSVQPGLQSCVCYDVGWSTSLGTEKT